jgi:hypothetical protein
MKRIINLDVRIFRAQGIVSADVRIRTFTVLCLAAGYRLVMNAGSRHRPISFSR